MSPHEELAIRAFVVKGRQERCLYLLAEPKRRQRFLRDLYHFGWLDESRTRAVPAPMAQSVEGIGDYLRSRGAGDTVWAISTERSIDGRYVELVEAIKAIWRAGAGSIISCIPGKLAYFENEERICLLVRE